MKFVKVLTIASLLCASTAALALPSEAAPFFSAGNNANCAPNYHTSYNGRNPWVNTGYNTGFNGTAYTGYNTGITGGFYNNSFFNQNDINRQIQRGIANGRISASEANRLMRDQQNLANLRARLASNGLSFSERARLQAATAKLEAQVRLATVTNNNRRFW